MAAGPNTFVTLQVFTAERFKGNPLAVVAIHGDSIPHPRKSLIAKEFGYSETVFLHDAPGPGLPRKCEIFTGQGEEIPFAGHPIIGVTLYIFSLLEKVPYRGLADRDAAPQRAVLSTKAGLVPVFYNNYRQLAACTVPHNVRVHSKSVTMDDIIKVQPQLQIVPTSEQVKEKSFPVVSIVKGMTFVLVDLTEAPELLAGLEKGEAPSVELDEGWSPSFVGAFYYTKSKTTTQAGEQQIHNIRARMICQGVEDPGTGSASCSLAAYLSLTRQVGEGLEQQVSGLRLDDKLEHHIFAIEQGVEMGRQCQIAVEVDLKRDTHGKPAVANIILSGRANAFLAGQIIGE